jgi:hypothetical protein
MALRLKDCLPGTGHVKAAYCAPALKKRVDFTALNSFGGTRNKKKIFLNEERC